MPADVVEAAHDAGLVPQDEDALTRHLDDKEVARLGHLRFPVDTQPLPGEEALHFLGEQLGSQEVAAGQGRLPMGGEFAGLPDDGGHVYALPFGEWP